MLKAIISEYDNHEFQVILEIHLNDKNVIRTLVDIVDTIEEAYDIIEKMKQEIAVVYHE